MKKKLFHKWRYDEDRIAGPCGGRLLPLKKRDHGEAQYECDKCGLQGKPITYIDKSCDAESNPIFLDGTDICVTDLLVPLSKFIPAFDEFMTKRGFKPIN